MNAAKRLARLKTLLARLESGGDANNRDLALILTDKQMDDLRKNWTEEKNERAAELPAELKQYNLLLKKAQLAYARLDSYSRKVGALKAKEHVKKKLLSYSARTFALAYEFVLEKQDDSWAINWLDKRISPHVFGKDDDHRRVSR